MAKRQRPVMGPTLGLAVQDVDVSAISPDDAEVNDPGGTSGPTSADDGQSPTEHNDAHDPASETAIPTPPVQAGPPQEPPAAGVPTEPVPGSPTEPVPGSPTEPDDEPVTGLDTPTNEPTDTPTDTPTDADGSAADPAQETARPARPGRGRLPRNGPPRTGRTPISVRRSPATQTAALRESLADKQAQAAELREALEALRQSLDEGPPSTGLVAPSRRRRRGLLWLLAGAAVLIVITVLALAGRGGTSTSVTASSRPSATPSAAAIATPSSTPTVTASATTATAPSTANATPTATLTPLPWPGGAVVVPPGVVTSGPGVDAPGTDLTVAIDPDGTHLDVYERVRFASAGVDAVAVALPPLTGLSKELAAANLSVSSLQIQLNGEVAPVVPTGEGWSARLSGERRVSQAVLLYRLAGAIVSVPQSVPGRFSAVLAPLTGVSSLAAGSPVLVHVDDARVRSLYCPTAPNQLCSRTSGTTRTGTLAPGATPIVALQLDLAR